MLQVGFFETLFAARSRRAVKPPHQRQRLLRRSGRCSLSSRRIFFQTAKHPSFVVGCRKQFWSNLADFGLIEPEDAAVDDGDEPSALGDIASEVAFSASPKTGAPVDLASGVGWGCVFPSGERCSALAPEATKPMQSSTILSMWLGSKSRGADRPTWHGCDNLSWSALPFIFSSCHTMGGKAVHNGRENPNRPQMNAPPAYHPPYNHRSSRRN